VIDELAEHDVDQVGAHGVSGTLKPAFDQFLRAHADHLVDLIQRHRAPAVGGQDMVGRCPQVRRGIDQCSIQVEDDSRAGHVGHDVMPELDPGISAENETGSPDQAR
jgi:hypothetical protein